VAGLPLLPGLSEFDQVARIIDTIGCATASAPAGRH
jgi:hypothetical protein